ncbi:MAG: 30S ribosomal protein S8 [Patescibacteria group bacterium]
MYIDLITKIKNAQQAKKEKIKVPYSNMDMVILEILSKYGYIGELAKKGRMPKRVIEIKLMYEDGLGAIAGVKIISKPSRRFYASYKDIKLVKQGYGLGLISTSKGIMAFHEARKQKVGGQLLFAIWK